MTRIEQLQQAMDGIDALVLRLGENILLATGYWLQVGGLGMAVVPRDGEATLVVPEYEEEEARALERRRPNLRDHQVRLGARRRRWRGSSAALPASTGWTAGRSASRSASR
jgi:Xaa-Pro aminopeptidase